MARRSISLVSFATRDCRRSTDSSRERAARGAGESGACSIGRGGSDALANARSVGGCCCGVGILAGGLSDVTNMGTVIFLYQTFFGLAVALEALE